MGRLGLGRRPPDSAAHRTCMPGVIAGWWPTDGELTPLLTTRTGASVRRLDYHRRRGHGPWRTGALTRGSCHWSPWLPVAASSHWRTRPVTRGGIAMQRIPTKLTIVSLGTLLTMLALAM